MRYTSTASSAEGGSEPYLLLREV